MKLKTFNLFMRTEIYLQSYMVRVMQITDLPNKAASFLQDENRLRFSKFGMQMMQ